MTHRLYYHDCYLRSFEARVVEVAGDRVFLDRTAFYPASGGQLSDRGRLAGRELLDAVEDGGRIAHVLASALGLQAGDEVDGVIDWRRRFDFMQQHTGQHLLSAVLAETFALQTISVHLGETISTIDVAAPAVSSEVLREAERLANEIVWQNRAVRIGFEPAGAAGGLRKASEREGLLRIVTIEGLDRSACGGTHVRATGEIGAILLRKPDRIRGNTRIEFLCGARAQARARADFEALSRSAQAFSAPLDEVPAMVLAQQERLQESEKARRKLVLELARAKGRALYESTAAGAGGFRRIQLPLEGIDDEARAVAQSFVAGPRAVFTGIVQSPPSILLAASDDSGIHAGNVLKAALAETGGRGGGNAQVAQGSLPNADALQRVIARLATVV